MYKVLKGCVYILLFSKCVFQNQFSKKLTLWRFRLIVWHLKILVVLALVSLTEWELIWDPWVEKGEGRGKLPSFNVMLERFIVNGYAPLSNCSILVDSGGISTICLRESCFFCHRFFFFLFAFPIYVKVVQVCYYNYYYYYYWVLARLVSIGYVSFPICLLLCYVAILLIKPSFSLQFCVLDCSFRVLLSFDSFNGILRLREKIFSCSFS